MSVIQTIKERRSIRRFKSTPVPKELLEKITEAGIWAASGMNRQAPVVIAVTDKEMRDKIAEANAQVMGRSAADSDPFYGAPAILAVIASKEAGTAVCDGSLTLGNMMLAAKELGLGTCWIHRAKEEFESDLGREILASLGLSGDYIGVGHLAVGYPDTDNPPAPPRKEGRVFFIE